jgi:hypothetical protein
MKSKLILLCDDKQLLNKYVAMKKKYEDTYRWINETGQGIKDDDPNSFEGKSMGHLFKTLN